MAKKTLDLPPVSIMTTVNEYGNPLSNPEIEQIRLRLMSLFGIDKTAEIRSFLKSPAGIEALNIVAEEIMLEEAFHRQHERDLRDAEIRRNRALGFLLLALMYKKADAEKLFREANIAYERVVLGHSGKSTVSNVKVKVASQSEAMYKSAHDNLTNYIEELNKQAETLESELETLQKDKVYLEQKYQTIENEVNKSLTLIKELPQNENPEINIKKIKAEIFNLDNKIEALSDEVAQMEEEGKDITEKFNLLNGYLLQRQDLENFLKMDVYTESGELIKPEDKQTRFHEAAFFLKPELKLVKHNDKMMILRHDQDPNKLSPTKLAEHAKRFDAEKEQYCLAAKVCALTKASESSELLTREKKLAERSEQLNNRMLLLTNQVSALSEGMDEINQLKQSKQMKPTTSVFSAPPLKKKPTHINESYHHMLKLMDPKHPNIGRLMSIAQGLTSTKTTDKQLKKLLLIRLEQSGVIEHSNEDSLHRQFLSSGPIQPETLHKLRERVSQHSSTVYPDEKQQADEASFSMAPFSTKPMK